VTPDPASGYSGVEWQSTPFHSFLEHGTFLLFPIMFGLNLHWASTTLYELELLWLLVLAVPLGIVGGDFMSGIVHWAADTYGSDETPVIGPSLVKPFRLHHLYPKDITTHGLISLTGNVCILAVPLLSGTLYLLWLLPGSGLLAFFVICFALTSAFTVATNQFHKWAHQENPPRFARWLQRTRLVLEPNHHQQHHTRPFDSNYCITNGWLNPVLNRIRFFRTLESTLLWLFGAETARAKSGGRY
jgi:ubiquitin-conjugating enzyme E2 variant